MTSDNHGDFPVDPTELLADVHCKWLADVDPNSVIEKLEINPTMVRHRGHTYGARSSFPHNSFEVDLVERRTSWDFSAIINDALDVWPVEYSRLCDALQGVEFEYFLTLACWTDGSSYGGYVDRNPIARLHQSGLDLDVNFYTL